MTVFRPNPLRKEAESLTQNTLPTIEGSYDGHRGWIYSLAVSPNLQRSGIGTALINHAEAALKAQGCMKINLQIMKGNEKVQAFYETVGYSVEEHVSMGKQIPSNIIKVDADGR